MRSIKLACHLFIFGLLLAACQKTDYDNSIHGEGIETGCFRIQSPGTGSTILPEFCHPFPKPGHQLDGRQTRHRKATYLQMDRRKKKGRISVSQLSNCLPITMVKPLRSPSHRRNSICIFSPKEFLPKELLI